MIIYSKTKAGADKTHLSRLRLTRKRTPQIISVYIAAAHQYSALPAVLGYGITSLIF